MGIYYDYFRARDAATAMSIAADGVWKRREVDSLSLKNFDAHVRIGMLLAFAKDAPWTVETVRSTHVWPPEPAPKTPEDFDRLPEDSPWWLSAYHLEEFAQEFSDALASINESEFQRLERDWKPTEEFDGWDLDLARSDFKNLVDLAKRAQAANDRLFLYSPAG